MPADNARVLDFFGLFGRIRQIVSRTDGNSKASNNQIEEALS